MALEFFTGFDHYATADLLAGVTPRFTSATASVVTIQSTIARNGGQALRCNGSTAHAVRAGLSDAATRWVGFAFYTSSLAASLNEAFFAMGDATHGSLIYNGGGAHISLRFTSGGILQVYRGKDVGATGVGTLLGASTNTLAATTWYFIEVKATIDNSAGVVEVWVNGAQWINLTGQDTRAGGGAFCNAFALSCPSGGMFTYYDDIYSLSTTGGAQTSRLGDVKCTAVVASAGDGAAAQFTPSTGTDNGAMVDEATPDGDTTYNASAAAGNVDTYAFAALGTTGPILGLNLHNHVRKTDAGTCDAEPVVRIGGTNYTGTAVPVSQTAGYLTQLYETSPATVAAWTAGEVDGAEFGVRHAA